MGGLLNDDVEAFVEAANAHGQAVSAHSQALSLPPS